MSRFNTLIAMAALTVLTAIPALAGGVGILPPSSASVAIDGNTVHAMGDKVTVYTNGTTLVQEIQTDLIWISDLRISPNHRYVAAIGRKQISETQNTGFVQILDLTTGRQSAVPARLCDELFKNPVAFSPDNVTVAIIWSGDVKLFNLQTGQLIDHPVNGFQNHDSTSVTFSQDGDRLLVGGPMETRVFHGMRFQPPVDQPTNPKPTPANKKHGWGVRGKG